MKTGIVCYSTYIPRNRIKLEDIGVAWRKNGLDIGKSLGVLEKAVASVDEDAITLAVESASKACINGDINLDEIEVLLVGSESHPYAVNPSASKVGEILGISNNYLAADLEFACKAGSAGIQLIYGLVESGKAKYGLAIGSDVAQSKPGDVLEFSAGSAAGSFILGKDRVIAELIDFSSFTSNTPDFWRRDGQRYPLHGGRFTGEPAYFAHVIGASKKLMEKLNMKPSDFDYAVFHMPNGKFPKEVAKKLGFSEEQVAPSLVVKYIGNPYSASSLVGLAATLDISKPNQKIFVCSYGSGAGSDAFYFKTTDLILDYQKKSIDSVTSQIADKNYINYFDVQKSNISKGVI